MSFDPDYPEAAGQRRHLQEHGISSRNPRLAFKLYEDVETHATQTNVVFQVAASVREWISADEALNLEDWR